MTPPRSSSGSHRRHHTPAIARPAIQKNCRRCHERISGPLAHCWMCGTGAAGIRWRRLFIHAAMVVASAAIALLAWHSIRG